MAETPYTAYSYLEGGLMAVINAFAQDAVDRAEPLTVAAAYAQCRDAALAESAIGAVGLEIESHLVDLDHVADPVPWKRVEAIAAVAGKVAPGSAVTVEPGGQIELSGPPAAGVAPAVARLRYEGTGARLALADRRLGLAYAGADPARAAWRSPPGACRPSSCRRWPTSLILLSRVAVPAICWPSAWARSGRSPHRQRWHINDLVVRDLGRARYRTLGLTDVNEPTLVAQHDPLMSPLVRDLAHVGQQEELWLPRGGDQARPGMLPPDVDALYAFKHPRAKRPSLPPGARGSPDHPARQPGHRHIPTLKSRSRRLPVANSYAVPRMAFGG